VDHTDSLPGTAVREVEEETDLDVEITGSRTWAEPSDGSSDGDNPAQPRTPGPSACGQGWRWQADRRGDRRRGEAVGRTAR
jgi:8-oxo-dGTP pyrophosphatase MutT (NUDIX family)